MKLYRALLLIGALGVLVRAATPPGAAELVPRTEAQDTPEVSIAATKEIPNPVAAPKPLKLHLERVVYAETLTAKKPEFVFVLGNMAYRSVEELKNGVRRLPPGTEIIWAPTCIRNGGEPLDTEQELAAFRAACSERGVTLTFVPSG